MRSVKSLIELRLVILLVSLLRLANDLDCLLGTQKLTDDARKRRAGFLQRLVILQVVFCFRLEMLSEIFDRPYMVYPLVGSENPDDLVVHFALVCELDASDDAHLHETPGY